MANKSLKRRFITVDSVFDVINTIFLVLFTLSILLPLIFVLSASFSDASAVSAGEVWLLPIRPSLLAYKYVFSNSKMLLGFWNSTVYTVLGTFFCMIITIAAAYPLSRNKMIGHKVYMFLIVFTMLFTGGLIPTFLVVKNLNMLDTIWSVTLVSAFQPWYIIIATTYFKTSIPSALYEAAEIDGCSDFMSMMKIVVPLAVPILAVIILYHGVWLWNSYFDAMIYLRSQEKWPLQIFLRDILIINNYGTFGIDSRELEMRAKLQTLLKYSTIVIASAPWMILYPLLQKFFVKGITVGAVKG